ncbi:MAG: chorismate synthase, partial [Planctomycetota bacterium]
MLKYWTSGESHGKAMVALVDGFPAGLKLDSGAINNELRRRQGGYGRGQRQKLETDQVDFLSGVWKETSLGSPLA